MSATLHLMSSSPGIKLQSAHACGRNNTSSPQALDMLVSNYSSLCEDLHTRSTSRLKNLLTMA